ncbi:MAG: type II secretion system ATPase GspE [Spirochaetota bacterium]
MAEPQPSEYDRTNAPFIGMQLGQVLVKLHKISPQELERALEAQQKNGIRLGELLVQKNIITEEELLKALSLQLGIEYRENLSPDQSMVLASNLPRGFIKKNNVVILRETDHQIEVAVNDPFQTEVIENIKSLARKNIKLVLAKKLDILRLSDLLAGEGAESADKVVEDMRGESGNIQIMDDLENTGEDVLDLANEAPVIKLVNLMITEALKARASDIHIEPSEEGISVRYRIDGVLYNVLSPPKKYQQAIISRIKIMAHLNIAENRLPQDGRIKVKYGTSDVDIRVSIIPSVLGERVVMRLLIKDQSRFDLSRLGMPRGVLEGLKQMLSTPHGIIIVSGPTGSGKTTTLYAAMQEINTPEKNIITIEDPVEYRIQGVSQIQVNPKINLTFASGLRSILRQDPEVIMVGEIRDRETAEIAIQAAMTGHLVFSTVHTNDAASGVVRLVEMGIEPFLIASTVLGFLSQRLVRVLCPSCKKGIKIDPEILTNEGLDPKPFQSKTVYTSAGCSGCRNTGFFDRIGIFEMIKMNDAVRKMIIEKRDASYIRNKCSETGFRSILEDGIQKVLQGTTSLEEIFRVIRE